MARQSTDRRLQAASVDVAEIAKFEALADDWWNPAGRMAQLHRINPVRISFMRGQMTSQFGRDPRHARPLSGLSILDVGCAGGLLCEPLARMGARVTGIDPAAASIAVATLHAQSVELAIDYRETTVETVVAAGETFDAVIASEVVEHVREPAAFVASCAALVRPGGLLLMSTINRTFKSFGLAIVGAEYLLRWLPVGTHDWQKFVTPAELERAMRRAGLRVTGSAGMIFDPFRQAWRLGEDEDVNYLMAAARPAE